MVPFGKKQFENHSAVTLQRFRIGPDLHSFGNSRGTGTDQTVTTNDLHHAQATCTPDAQPFQVTERWDRDTILTSNLQNRLILAAAHVGAVDFEGKNTQHAIAVEFESA
jgi:hypothetical protein